TATNATYLARKATEQFGPCGTGWGITVLSEDVFVGAPHIIDGQVVANDMIHKVHARLWYVFEGVRGEVEQFGQTQIVGKNKNGFYTDEEAPKKSLTDAMSKCLSLLGFSADIHMGMYDDNKYVASITKEFAEDKAKTFSEAIKAAENLEQLNDIGSKLAAAGLPADMLTGLRHEFSKRKVQLEPTAAPQEQAA
ncbi:MAG TPA: hypothetical protein VFS91_06410, partial [Nitrobacter sp.]|nr:hypothetical protein [Nitrobacter sp.]